MDFFSRWPEVKFVNQVTTNDVTKFLEELWNREGIPKQIVTDNGIQFVSQTVKDFLAVNGVEHVRASVYYPQSNGLVERWNRVLKESFQLTLSQGENWRKEMSKLV